MKIKILKSIVMFLLLSILNTITYLLIPLDKFNYRNRIFRERKWEEHGALYQRLFKVKRWKDALPELGDFIPFIFSKRKIASLDRNYIKKFAAETCRAEICHWSIIFCMLVYCIFHMNLINVVILSVTILLNMPFIMIQRYNRPRITNKLDQRVKYRHNVEKDLAGLSGLSQNGRILFLSADNTGNGHKSITEALRCQILKRDSSIQVTVLDGFSMGKGIFRTLGSLYNPIAVNVSVLWGWIYRLSDHMAHLVNIICSRIIKKKLLQFIDEIKPDVIVSVHALFVGSVLKILQKNHKDIPVIAFIADLDNVSSLWADKKAKYILCPTQEAKEKMLSLGMPQEKLKVVGFPVREEFCNYMPDLYTTSFSLKKDSISILLMSGSQGSRQIQKMAKELLENCNCRITIIAGKNEALKEQLEREFHIYPEERISILGFTENIKKYMLEADVLILRASPNVLMEAVNLCRPMIVTGALTGQEEKNPEYVKKHQLGVVCKNNEKLPYIVNDMLTANGEKLITMRNNLVQFRKPEAASQIAAFIINQCCNEIKKRSASVSNTQSKMTEAALSDFGERFSI